IPSDTLICQDSTFVWNLGIDTAFYDVLWNSGNQSATEIVNQNGVFQVSIADSLNCNFQSDSISVTLSNFAANATLGVDRFVCVGDSIGLVLEAEKAINYTWSTGDTTSKIEILNSGSYSLIAQNQI